MNGSGVRGSGRARMVTGVLLVAAAMVAGAAPSWAGPPPADRFKPTITAPWAVGDDETSLDSAAAAAGLCRSAPFTSTAAYPATSDVDAIVGDAVNDSGVSNFGCMTAQNETSVAVDPTDANHVVVGANDYRVCCDTAGLNDSTVWAYVSWDGGATWTNVQVPGFTVQTGGAGVFKNVDSGGDPSLAFGPDGTLYYANIVFSRTADVNGVAVAVSRDGGRSWSMPNMVTYEAAANYFNDKAWIAAGPNGQAVVTWTRFYQGAKGEGYLRSPIVAAYSANGGRSWSRQGSPVSDAAHPYDQGSMPVYASDGTLYVAYEGSQPSTQFATDATVVARSVDGGRTFQNVEVGRVFDDLDCYPEYAGRQTLTDEHFRLNSYPSLGVDPVTGSIAVVWSDDEGAGTCGGGGSVFTGTTSSQVKLVSGAWGALSAPTRISPGAGDKVFPSVSIRAGRISASYYTRDYAATHDPAVCNVVTTEGAGIQTGTSPRSVCLDYASRTSADGFAAESRLTSDGSNPYVQFADGSFIGDYTQIATGSDGVAHAAWTDFRGRPGTTSANQDVYVASVR